MMERHFSHQNLNQTGTFKPCYHTKVRALVWRYSLALLLGFSLLSPTIASADKNEKKQLKLFEKEALNFGTVAGSSDGPSTIVLSPTGTVTTTGYAFVIENDLEIGKYNVKGPGNATVLITLPNTVTLSNGYSQAILSNFTSSPSGVVKLNSHGKLTIKIGATLTIPVGQAGGEYSGPMTIYVDFQ